MALCTWAHVLANRDVLVFVDDEPAKDCVIHGISSSEVSARLVRFTRRKCAELALGVWYDRVASPSNIADDPSRAIFSALLKIGAKKVEPIVRECSDAIGFVPFESTE